MSTVNFILQGKGGVGKSLSAALLAQYLIKTGKDVVCADTDPVNGTFSQYQSLNVTHVDILDGATVMQRKFDPLIEKIVETDADFVIDNGASTFLPLTNYMSQNDIFDLLADHGKKVIVHTILTAGQAKADTLNGFAELIKTVGDKATIVLWLNEFWGPIEFDGQPITSLALFEKNQDKIAGLVRIENRGNSDAFTTDVKLMTENHLTLDDVLNSTEFGVVAKSRLRKVVNAVFEELESVEW